MDDQSRDELTPNSPAPPAAVTPSPHPHRRHVIAAASALGVGAVLAALYEGLPRLRQATVPESAKLGHLLRRAGFGASPDERKQYEQMGLAATTNQLIDYESVANPMLDKIEQFYSFDHTNGHDLQRWWLLRMLYSARPLEERMTLFWHSLLTSAFSKVRPDMMYVQNLFFRQHALDTYPALLKGVSKDPAMMVWLDLQTNRKGHANENFARELMELFSMGVGNYTEQDVRESSRAFTGYTLRYPGPNTPGLFNPPTYVFNPKLHDDGPKTFLGHTGNFTGDDIIDIIVATPAAATYICKRLFSWFAYDNPEPSVLNALIKTYYDSAYSIKALVRQILTSDAFYSAKAYRSTIKSPVDYVVGSLRALGMLTEGNQLPNVMPAMGQEIFNPPNVAGWPGGTSWLTSGTWLARLNYANAVTAGTVAFPRGTGSVGEWLQQTANDSGTAAVTFLSRQLLDGQIGTAQQQVLLQYANDSSMTADERYRGLTYLALGLPENHLS